MSITESISKKTCYTVAVGISLLLWVILVTSIGLGISYVPLQEYDMELFKRLIYLVIIFDPPFITLQLILMGLIKSFTLKSLRPINEAIIGEEFRPDITRNQLEATIQSLRSFPSINGVLAFLTSSAVISIFTAIVFHWGYRGVVFYILLAAGASIIVVYTAVNFFYADSKAHQMIKKGHQILYHLKRRGK